MSKDTIEAADRILRLAPHAYSAALIQRLHDDLIHTEDELSRIVSTVHQWIEDHRNDQKHAPGPAKTIHERALEDLAVRISSVTAKG
jgi:hypothetical protein